MASWVSTITSQYSSIRRLLPTSLSEDSDLKISDPQDSHVSRVLRAYYTEKGRPFPPWLGPDPNAPVRPAIISQPSTPGLASSGGSFRGSKSGAGGLGDLFGDSTSQASNQSADSLSLRNRKPNLRSPGYQGGSSDSIPYPSRVPLNVPSAHSAQPAPSPMARPLPSQRAGSYQTRSNMPPANPSTTSPASQLSAQERLKARLGARSGGSSTPNSYDSGRSNSGGNFNPYESMGTSPGSFNPYETSGASNPYANAAASNDGRSASGGSAAGGRYGAGTSWLGAEGGTRSEVDSSGSSSRRGPTLPSHPRRGKQ